MTKVSRPDANETQQVAHVQHATEGKIVKRCLLCFVVLVCIVLLLLPTIASWVLTSPRAMSWVSGQPAGMIEVGEASIPWQGPVKLSNVVVHAPDGHPIANVKTMTTEHSLWNFLTKPRGPLTLHLDGMRIPLKMAQPGKFKGRIDVSELTSTLQSFQLPRPSQAMNVRITNGTIDFQNPQHELVDSWSNISADYSYRTTGDQQQTVSVLMPDSDEKGTGALELKGQWTKKNDAVKTESLSIEGQGEHLSLVALDAWLTRFLGPDHGITTCTGTFEASLQRDQKSGWELKASARFDEPATDLSVPTNTAPIEQVAYAEPTGPQAEPTSPQAELEIQGKYSKPDDELIIPRLHLAADDAVLSLKGSVKDVSRQQILDLLAEVQTPGPALLELLPIEIRDQIQLEGTKFSQISISGSLSPSADGSVQPLTYSLLAEWKKARAYGLESDNGQLRISFSNGLVRAEPVNVPISGGHLLRLPVLDLRTQPPTLEFQKGVMLENVRLTAEVCRDWLMYISPTLANATSADGQLSLTMQSGRMIIGQPDESQLAGTLSIRNGRVRPGPLTVQILQEVSRIQRLVGLNGVDLTQKSLLTMPQEDINFEMRDGRVYHNNFGANVGNVRLATAGSVGLDQTLALQVQIALPEKWKQNNRPLLQALGGQPIAFQINGTLEHPEIDASGLAELGKTIGIKAGVNLLERLIERRRRRNR